MTSPASKVEGLCHPWMVLYLLQAPNQGERAKFRLGLVGITEPNPTQDPIALRSPTAELYGGSAPKILA